MAPLMLVAEQKAARALAKAATSLTELTESECLAALSHRDLDRPHLRDLALGRAPERG